MFIISKNVNKKQDQYTSSAFLPGMSSCSLSNGSSAMDSLFLLAIQPIDRQARFFLSSSSMIFCAIF
jgi:hypothetical protein